MKLEFTAPVEQLEKEKGRILEAASAFLPGAYVEVDPRAALIAVELPEGVDPEAAAEALSLRFLSIGVNVTKKETVAGNTDFGKPSTGGESLPPLRMAPKPPRTVKLSHFVLALVCVVLVVGMISLSVGFVLGKALSPVADESLGTAGGDESYIEKISLVDNIFKNYSLYDTDGNLLLDSMLKAYAAATGDKYAAYYTDEELAVLLSDIEGDAVGIGVTVTIDRATGNILVVQVSKGSPAETAGILPGDLITRIGTLAEGEDVVTLGYAVAKERLLGEVGTEAQIVVERGGVQIEFSITRAKFLFTTVTGWVSEVDSSVGIVRISQFAAHTPAEFKKTVNDLILKGCQRFVYDVRNNPGGEQRAIGTVISYFANENDTLYTVTSKDGATSVYRARAVEYSGTYADCSVAKEEIGMYRSYPATVLTNGSTASAAELFTGALRDYGLVKTVGTTTYGKGVIQNIIDLKPYGYSGGIKLTIGYFAPPSGVNYDGVGIAADIPVQMAEEVAGKHIYLLEESSDTQLCAAISAVLAAQ